ncbi:MAG TPA: class I SAM-dependent methyltransferase [Candidatus Limnocylindrales bacterium]
MTDLRSSAERWDRKYAERAALWSGHANPALREVAARLEPGTALDVGCGEGGDAVWLAERGWTVVGIDLSAVALERATAAAAERGVGERCTWIAGDVTQGVVASGIASGIGTDGGFDLVTSHYLHEPPEVRAAAWLAETDLTAPGGVLLIVGHHPDDEAPAGRGPRDPSVLFSPEEVAEALSAVRGLEVETSEMRERLADGPDGPITRRDTVVVARRT